MSGAPATAWPGGGVVAAPATPRLHAAVRALTRARWQQILLDHAWAGLFTGLSVSCAALAAIRFAGVPAPASPAAVVGWIVGAALALSALLAWRRRPDDLAVAIRADLQLRLEQKLSTAWELARRGAEPALRECLAAQAMRSRIPARCEHVFPLRVNAWGRLVPLAAAALALVAVIEPRPAAERAPAPVPDPVVASEGVRLRDYGRGMESRARRDGLEESAARARDMQRLGSRMESGALSRRQVLTRLRALSADLDEQRRAALREANEIPAGPLGVRSLPGGRPPAPGLQAMLRELLDGRLPPGATALSADDEAALSRLGLSAKDLERALENLRGGDGRALRDLLDELARDSRAAREAQELGGAREQVDRARENLGDARPSARRGMEPGGDPAPGAGDEGAGGPGNAGDVPGLDGDGTGTSGGSGVGDSAQSQRRQRERAPGDEDVEGGAVLEPDSQVREGSVFATEARVMPRRNAPSIEPVEVDARFAAQLEAVLSKDDYPLHYKEFIRRYFLTLGEGVPRDDGTAGEPGP